VKDIPGIDCPEPDGAFYVFPDISYYFGKTDGSTTIRNSADMSLYLLNQAHVSSVTGSAFGEQNCVRFSFANSMSNIEEGWKRVKEGLSKLR
jgi:aspartate aminotransferase